MTEPTGISQANVIKTLAGLRAFGEIMNVPGPQLDGILAAARAELERKPDSPPGPPAPPPIP